jgi:hypothetical protein
MYWRVWLRHAEWGKGGKGRKGRKGDEPEGRDSFHPKEICLVNIRKPDDGVFFPFILLREFIPFLHVRRMNECKYECMYM